MRRIKKKLSFFAPFMLIIAVLLSSCSADKFITDGQYLLDKVELRSDAKDLNASELAQYVRQKENARWFSFFKVPLETYALAGRDTTKWINRTLKRIGEEPVLFDTLQAKLSCEDLRLAMNNMGYMQARVDLETKTKGKKLKAIYHLIPGDPFHIKNFRYDIQDSIISDLLHTELSNDFTQGRPQQFTVSALDGERKRITKLLNDKG